MVFPLGYSELLLQIVFFMGFIRRIISWAFNVAGLADLLDSDGPWPDPSSVMNTHNQNHQVHQQQQQEVRSVSAMLIQEILPVVKFATLPSAGAMVADSCAVCLYEFEAEDEVRRLSNCRHVFHRCCLDRWMEHGQRTCPLCRTPLVPEEMQDAFNDRMWVAAGLPDSYTADLHENYLSLIYSPALSFGQLITA